MSMDYWMWRNSKWKSTSHKYRGSMSTQKFQRWCSSNNMWSERRAFLSRWTSSLAKVQSFMGTSGPHYPRKSSLRSSMVQKKVSFKATLTTWRDSSISRLNNFKSTSWTLQLSIIKTNSHGVSSKSLTRTQCQSIRRSIRPSTPLLLSHFCMV